MKPTCYVVSGKNFETGGSSASIGGGKNDDIGFLATTTEHCVMIFWRTARVSHKKKIFDVCTTSLLTDF